MRNASVPGPPGRWLVGSVIEYDQDRIGWLTSTKDRYGDVVRLAPDITVLHDPADIHQVLAATNRDYILDNALEPGRRFDQRAQAALQDWMDIRRRTWHSLDREMVAAHLSRIRESLTSGLRETAGTDIDVFAFAQRLFGEAVAGFCLGADGAVDDVVDAVEHLFWDSVEMMERREARVRLAFRPVTARARRSNRQLLAVLHERLRRRRSGGHTGPPRDILDMLLAHPEPPADDVLAAVLRITMVASHGVPGSALTWAMLRLGNHPDVREQVQAETGDLGYTTAVVKEVLRLHPPTWLLGRRAIRAVRIGEYEFTPGHQFLFSPYLVHRDPRWWSDPETFSPQRWIGRQPPHTRYAYLPFGAGPRVCPGAHLGMVQLALVLSEIARNYRLVLPAMDAVPPRSDSILVPAGLRGRWEPVGAGAGAGAGG